MGIYFYSYCVLYIHVQGKKFTSITTEVPSRQSGKTLTVLCPDYKFTVSTKTLKSDLWKKTEYRILILLSNILSHSIVWFNTTTYKGEQNKCFRSHRNTYLSQIAPGIVSFQHGTMFADSDGASNAVSDGFPFFSRKMSGPKLV